MVIIYTRPRRHEMAVVKLIPLVKSTKLFTFSVLHLINSRRLQDAICNRICSVMCG